MKGFALPPKHLNMRPELAANDLPDCGLVHAKLTGQSSLAQRARSDRLNGPCVQLAHATTFASRVVFYGVLDVFLMCKVFQIIRTIVSRIPVNVIRLLARRAWANKGLCYESVYPAVFGDLISGESDRQVTLPKFLFQYVSCKAASAIKATAYTAKITNFVTSIASVRQTSPFFPREFFWGKFLSSHCGFSSSENAFWSGSLAAQTACGPFCILTRAGFAL